ncbi:MAG TPA: NAD(P)-dependent oxidoreductase [Burkholderiaceae bacterium]|nr:NAD(P)-dependent oxidoreductase [Burkholderiaceae bacterium]
MSTQTIGFVGLGAMGGAMVEHLMTAGYSLRVYARRAEVMQPFIKRGGVGCASPGETARGAEIVLINVTSTSDVEQVLFGKEGVIESAAAGTVVIDHGTISAIATRQFAQRLADRGIEMLDCPVSGGARGAQAATLSIMVGGKQQVFERARPLLEKLGKTITYCGDHGAGQIVKACNQIVQVINIQGIAEAMLFARANGVDPATMLNAISAGFAGSKMLDLLGPKMASRDFAAGMQAWLHHKDYGLVVDMARESNLAMPAVALVAQQLNALVGHGWGNLDTSALLKVLEATSGRSNE